MALLEDNDSSLKRRLRLDFAYDGSAYHGWQAQDGLSCIQTTLEKRLNFIFKNSSRLQSSSRTDAGVHAIHSVGHVDVDPSVILNPERLKMALNRMLPLNVRILDVKDVEQNFHARYSAIGKCYCYVFNISKSPSVFMSQYACYEPRLKHINLMRIALKTLEGTHDFAALYCQGSVVPKSTVRTMYASHVEQVGDYILCSICGDGFLYKMVRSIMGVLRDIGTGNHPVEIMQTLLNSPKRTQLAQTAQGNGLYLCKVYYQNPQNWHDETIKNLPFSF